MAVRQGFVPSRGERRRAARRLNPCRVAKTERMRGNGGEAGIRTLGTAFRPYNGLANRRLQPLGHLTAPCKSKRKLDLPIRHFSESSRRFFRTAATADFFRNSAIKRGQRRDSLGGSAFRTRQDWTALLVRTVAAGEAWHSQKRPEWAVRDRVWPRPVAATCQRRTIRQREWPCRPTELREFPG